MKTKLFETKRRATTGGFRFLHAQTRRKKKQHVAAAASNGDFAVEEPNLGVARALVVILLLHLAAIAAIVVHNHSTKKDLAMTGTTAPTEPKVAAAAKPKIGEGDETYFVQPGDTYERIARSYGLDSDYLRRLNNNAPLSSDLALRLPAGAKPVEAPVPSEPEASEAYAMSQLPPIQDVAPSTLPSEYEVLAEPVAIETPLPPLGEEVAAAPVPVVEQVASVIEPVEVAPAPVEVQVEEAPKKPATRTHTLKSGETVWSLSRKYGVSQQQLLSLNGIKDARKMRVGMELKIPQN